MLSEFVEIPLWVMDDGFVIMNSEFALARQNTLKKRSFTEPEEIECPCNNPNPDDAGACQNCGEVGIIEV